jgi:hypothetical protein
MAWAVSSSSSSSIPGRIAIGLPFVVSKRLYGRMNDLWRTGSGF